MVASLVETSVASKDEWKAGLMVDLRVDWRVLSRAGRLAVEMAVGLESS